MNKPNPDTQRRYREQHWRDEKCIHCPRPAVRGKIRCMRHLLYAAAFARRYYKPKGREV